MTLTSGGRAGLVSHRVGERLLHDAEQRQAHGAAHLVQAAVHGQAHVDAGLGEPVDELHDVAAPGLGRLDAAVGFGAQQPDGVADLVQALPARPLRLQQRLGRGIVVASRDGQAGGGDVEHGDGHRVGDHVVDLAGDPLALVGGGLLGEARPRRP